jgi:aerobic carbon-monoxide dehydrogenase large subunit
MAVEDAPAPTTGLIGARVGRIEDSRLLTGRSQFMDDLQVPRLAEAAVLRSPLAHAEIKRIDVSAARAMPGVIDVLTGAELAPHVEPQPVIYQLLPDQRSTGAIAMAVDRVRWAGQIVAAVLADDRYLAEDALQEIDVEYEPLPVVANLDAALEEGGTRLYDDWPDNIVGKVAYANGDAEQAIADAAVVVSEKFSLGRMLGCPLETRGCIATWDPYTDELDIWMSTQSPHLARDLLGETLRLPGHKIRVRVPDVGGGFGNKFDFYGEEVIASVLSRRSGRSVKLLEDRLESFVATSQSRDAVIDATLALDQDGTIVALKASVYGTLGGAMGTVGVGPAWLTTTMLTSVYKIPNVAVDLTAVVTNRAPMGSFRGWGQPEANFAIERLVQLAARKLAIESAQLRRRNFPTPEEFPFVTGVVFAYDSGRYEECLDLCLDGVREQGWHKRISEARAEGRAVGLGLSFHVEATAFGPSRILNLVGLQHSGFDEEVVRIDSTGHVTVFTGQAAMGQGIETALAQVAAQTLGIDLEDVTIVSGDTTNCPYTGYGTGASRGAAMGGATLMKAAEVLREKVKRIGAHQLEAAAEDIEIRGGRVFVRGSEHQAVTLAEIGDAAYRRLNGKFPEDEDPTLEERYVFDPENLAWSYGCTAALVEVDRETGFTTVLGYLVAHDCGTVINPTIVDGQLHGGAAQGIAEALFEELVYNEEGQLTTGTFMDYAIPTFMEIPRFDLRHMDTPAPHIPGGMKGMGEAGTIGAPAAIAGAIDDALSDLGVTVTSVPATPARLHALIQEAQR